MTKDVIDPPPPPKTPDSEKRTVYKNPLTGELESMTEEKFKSLVEEATEKKRQEQKEAVKGKEVEIDVISEDNENQETEITDKESTQVEPVKVEDSGIDKDIEQVDVKGLSPEEQKKRKREELNSLPINKYLFPKDKAKYKYQEKIMDYKTNNIDEINANIRYVNAFLAQIRHTNYVVKKHEEEYYGNKEITAVNDKGVIMGKEELFGAICTERQRPHGFMASIRSLLVDGLLMKVDGEVFTFEDYDNFVEGVEKVAISLGYILFPKKAEIIKPL